MSPTLLQNELCPTKYVYAAFSFFASLVHRATEHVSNKLYRTLCANTNRASEMCNLRSPLSKSWWIKYYIFGRLNFVAVWNLASTVVVLQHVKRF